MKLFIKINVIQKVIIEALEIKWDIIRAHKPRIINVRKHKET